MSRRRQQRGSGGRLLIWAFVLGLLAAALMYLRCGEGLGFGPGGGDDGDHGRAEEKQDLRPAVGEATGRCRLRVDGKGITLNGKRSEIDGAVEACKQAGGGAELTATGAAKHGTVEELKAALDKAGVSVLERDPATPPPAPR
jgi:hypothetical protein